MLKITGKKEILNNEILVIEGGFGEGKKILFDIQIAEIHNMRNNQIRESINRLIGRGRLVEGIDFIDIKKGDEQFVTFDLTELYAKQSISQARNIFILSERGYSKLIKSMDDDTSWDVHDKMIEDYFTMRSIINSQEQIKKDLIYALYSGGIDSIEAHKRLVALEVKPLQEKIKEDEPLVTFGKTVLKSNDNILVRELAKVICGEGIKIGERKLYQKLREWKLIIPASTEPYQKYINNGYFVVEEKPFVTPYGDRLGRVTKVTVKGQIAIINKLKKENI